MATYTPNYNFYLPALGDGVLNGKPWGVRINANFSSIDTTLHGFNVSITGLSSSVTTLQGQIGAGGVPTFTSGDNGKVLGISSGALAWISTPYVTHASGHLAGGTDAISWGTVHGRGTTASKPAAGASNTGYLYFDTTLSKLQRSDGTTWEDCEGSGGGGSSTDVYSSSEVLTNKTWNGKAVYRVLFNFGALTNATQKTVAHGITGVTEWLPPHGKASDGSSTIPLPFAPPSTSACVGMWVDGTYVYIWPGTNRTTYSAYVILEYTKT